MVPLHSRLVIPTMFPLSWTDLQFQSVYPLSFVLFLNSRTPFEMNTALRWAFMDLYQAFVSLCTCFVFSAVPSLLCAFMLYFEACRCDIKSMITELDRLSLPKSDSAGKRKTSNLTQREDPHYKMQEHVKEIIDLHQKLNQ